MGKIICQECFEAEATMQSDDGTYLCMDCYSKKPEESLTEEDKNTIHYFITEKGDIERWCDWKDKKHQVQKEFPELIAALNQLKIAERTLDAVVKNIL